MSWDIYIQDLPPVASVSQIPDDHVPKPIGCRMELMEKVQSALPGSEGEGQHWLFLRDEGVDMSIQFHMEDSERVRYLLVHIFGGDKAPECVARILDVTGLRALDTETGEFFGKVG